MQNYANKVKRNTDIRLKFQNVLFIKMSTRTFFFYKIPYNAFFSNIKKLKTATTIRKNHRLANYKLSENSYKREP